ncbi:MAG: bifunctional 3-(3-hydroxy-phenyl)propionate/3-hydroxycinnamic acid hydroxylase [Myxococcota bacterium]
MAPSPSTPDCDYDVSIVGYGPVAATTALLLARRGFRVSIHERSTQALELPRAVGLDGESIRLFQSLGFGEDVDALVQPYREGDALWFTDSKRNKLFGIDTASHAGHNGWRDLAMFDQPELEALLREQVAKDEAIDVFLGEEGIALRDEDTRVALDVRDVAKDTTRTVTARYLVGADGASSFVRRALGIPWTSLGYDQDWLVIDILVDDPRRLPLPTMQVCDPDRLTTYVSVKDPNRRWEFQLKPGETREEMERPEAIDALLEPWLPKDAYSIRRAVVYQFHAATAERWRAGRILIAGDAAHQTPPFLGQGLNTGLRDALNLSWKLALVLEGRCDDALLDSYFDERDAHARTLVDGACDIGKLMETLAAREAGRPEPHPGWVPSLDVGEGRVALAIEGGVLNESQRAEGIPIGEPLRQPQVRARGTSEVATRLDEHLGGGFALVGRSEADLVLDEDATALAERLGLRCLALDALEVAEGEHDRAFDAARGVLLRPDHYVFGVVDERTDASALVRAAAEKLALRV